MSIEKKQKRTSVKKKEHKQRKAERLKTLYQSIQSGTAIDSEVREFTKLLTEAIGQRILFKRNTVELVLNDLGLSAWTGQRATAAVQTALSHVGDGTDWREGFFYDLKAEADRLSHEAAERLSIDVTDQVARELATQGQWLLVWHNMLIEAPITKSVRMHDSGYCNTKTRQLVMSALSRYIDALSSFPQHQKKVLDEILAWEIGEGDYKDTFVNAPIARVAAPSDYVQIFQNPETLQLLQTTGATFIEQKKRDVQTGQSVVSYYTTTPSFTLTIHGKKGKLSVHAYRLFTLALIHLTALNSTHTKSPKNEIQIKMNEWYQLCGFANAETADRQLRLAIVELRAASLNGMFVSYPPGKKPVKKPRLMSILGTVEPNADGYELTFDTKFVSWIVDTFTMVFPSVQFLKLKAADGALLFYLFQLRQMKETKSRQPVTEIYVSVSSLIENFPTIVKESARTDKQKAAYKKNPKQLIIKPLFEGLDRFSADIDYELCDSQKQTVTDVAGLPLTNYAAIASSKRRYPSLITDTVKINFKRLKNVLLH